MRPLTAWNSAAYNALPLAERTIYRQGVCAGMRHTLMNEARWARESGDRNRCRLHVSIARFWNRELVRERRFNRDMEQYRRAS